MEDADAIEKAFGCARASLAFQDNHDRRRDPTGDDSRADRGNERSSGSRAIPPPTGGSGADHVGRVDE